MSTIDEGNKVHEEMERIIWGGDMHINNPETWRPLAVPQNNEWIIFDGLEPNAEYEFDPKTHTLKRIHRPMTTLYKTDNEHLRKAFIEELKELAYNTYNSFDLSIVFTRDDHVGTCVTGSIISDQTPKTFNLKTQWNEALQHATEQLQPKFKVGDWVVVKNIGSQLSAWKDYIGAKEGTVYKIDRIEYDSGLATKDDPRYVSQEGYNHRAEDLRRATQEEIEQATRKTFFDWGVTKSKNTTKIGCQTFDNVFLQRLTDAIGELERDVTIEELINELENIGFEYIDPLPF